MEDLPDLGPVGPRSCRSRRIIDSSPDSSQIRPNTHPDTQPRVTPYQGPIADVNRDEAIGRVEVTISPRSMSPRPRTGSEAEDVLLASDLDLLVSVLGHPDSVIRLGQSDSVIRLGQSDSVIRLGQSDSVIDLVLLTSSPDLVLLTSSPDPVSPVTSPK